MATIYPVIMAGGTGSRLWPLSRKARPKQFQPLLSERSMLEETVNRIAAVTGRDVAPPTIVCGAAHEEFVRDALARSETALRQLVLEPIGRNTAPVAIIAASLVAADDPEGLILLLPADHHIAETGAFGNAVARGADAADKGYLATFGIEAIHPETGYGYICRGENIAEGVAQVDRFVEKPDRHTAEDYLADGRYTWNAGIFLFRAGTFLEEAERHAALITAGVRAALAASRIQGDTVRLDPDTFSSVPADSIDYAIMEKTERAAVVGPVRMGWNDIGSWRAVKEMAVATGDDRNVISKDCSGVHVHTDGPFVATVGLDNIIVVATGDAVLVIDADRAQDIKEIVEELTSAGRDDLL